MVIVFVDMAQIGSQSQTLSIQSDVVSSTARDVKGNLPILAKIIFQETANDVIRTGNPLQNSRMTIENSLQIKVNSLTEKYHKEGINVSCNITSVDSSNDPFKVQINSTISINKGNVIHRENLSHDVSIIHPNYPIPDPLPFIILRDHGGVTNTSNRIIYGSSLVRFLESKNMTNAEVYLNATSPLIIRKCPYDPYKTHNRSNLTNLRNCVDNGFYHISNESACFLCRLERRVECQHMGIETFIIPAATTNNNTTMAPVSICHVIFSVGGTGSKIIYRFNATHLYKLYLDGGHRSKYGITVI
ncbi:MAG: hypothetical protein PQ964_03575 [Methanobacteriaceae archaeon]